MFEQHVYVLSTDATLPAALAAAGVDHTVFGDSRTLVAALPVHARGVVIVDLQLPGAAGYAYLRKSRTPTAMPVIILTTEGDVSSAVEGMRQGALDVIEKPFDNTNAVARVRAALRAESNRWVSRRQALSIAHRIGTLTPRETQVLGQLSLGQSNRETGSVLGISPRTVEVHRGRIMGKMGSKSMTSLIRMIIEAGLGDALPALPLAP